jgi:hypothetical protein
MTFSIVGPLTITVSTSAPFVYRTNETITITTPNIAGSASFKQGKVRIPGCTSMPVTSGNSYSVTCNWKPSTHSATTIFITVTPSSGPYVASTTALPVSNILVRSTNR